MKGRIAVVDYGMGNIHSLIKALRLFYDDVVFTGDFAELKKASALVLPGDGAFAAAMARLNMGTADIIREHLNQEKPMLGVCIGFQVLFEDSDETHTYNPIDSSVAASAGGDFVAADDPDKKAVLTKGLGILKGNVRRFKFDSDLRIPHMGWNPVIDRQGRDLDHMYFIHSYRACNVAEEFVEYKCEYGGDVFPAAVRHKSLLATQFHPEKSDKPGLALLKNWINEK